MGKFIVGTFMLLGFGFYELSGGAEFEPEVRPIQQAVISTKTLEAVPTSEPAVTRAVAQAFPIEPEAEVFHASLTILDAPVQDTTQDPAATSIDLREVAGKRVNMRSGPGTNFDVLDTLNRGTQAEVIEVNADGWARIRITDSDQIGWMAERLLTNS